MCTVLYRNLCPRGKIDFLRITKKNGYKEEDKIRLDNFCIECQEAVETEKLNYLSFFFFFFYGFLSRTMTTHAESINSDLQRGLDRHLRNTQH